MPRTRCKLAENMQGERRKRLHTAPVILWQFQDQVSPLKAGEILTFWFTMSSLEDGFGGGVDDMVSANTAGELRNLFWEVGAKRQGAITPCGTPARCASGQLLFAVGANGGNLQMAPNVSCD
jgi:hypothetical protein